MPLSFGIQTSARFYDRSSAGASLATLLRQYANERHVIVLGLARGGVPVARAVADAIGARLDVFVANKVGVPGIEDVALCAVAEGSEQLVNDAVAWYIGVPPGVLKRLSASARVEVERRVRVYRRGRKLTDLRGRTVIVVDDGIATGATMCAAVEAIRAQQPGKIIVAVPVATTAGADEVRPNVDSLVVAREVSARQAVSSMYEHCTPVGDADVLALLGLPRVLVPSRVVQDVSERITNARVYGTSARVRVEQQLSIPVEGGYLLADYGAPFPVRSRGVLDVDDECAGLVVLVNGRGSNRHSYRNRYIAGRLRMGGYATIRLDLMTSDEQLRDVKDASLQFDVWEGAGRVIATCGWLRRAGYAGADAPIIMGSRSAAAAALYAATVLRNNIGGVIARSGRVDLAYDALQYMKSPVLMIAGGRDNATIERSKIAHRLFGSSARLVRVKGAGHTFEEPGALGAVAEHAIEWLRTLSPRSPADEPARITAPSRAAHD